MTGASDRLAPQAKPPPAPGGRASFAADSVLLVITALWGLTFVTVKDALTNADPLTFLALRFSLGAVVAAALAGQGLKSRSAWRSGLILGTFLFIGFVLQTYGLEQTTPSRSAFLTGLTVILVPFVSTALNRRLPPLPAFLGALLAVVGLQRMTGATFHEALPLGDLLTLGATVAYAFHITFTERLSPRDAPTAIVAAQLTVTAALCLLFLPFGPRHFTPTWSLGGALVVTGVFASALAISLQTWAQARTVAVRAALLFSLEPVFASAYSALLGRESIGVRELVGGGFIILGVAVSEVGAAVQRRNATPPGSALPHAE